MKSSWRFLSSTIAAALLILILFHGTNFSYHRCVVFIDRINLFNRLVQPKTEAPKAPLALLISYDGFRYDYLDRANAPNLKWLISKGVYVPEGLKNTFITITAPNHYGLVTGLYEESHGIVANYFFDPELNKTFNYFTDNNLTDPRFFRRGEPIWVTNDKTEDGLSRRSGCVMWVGCDIEIRGRMPQFHISWDEEFKWKDRIDQLISWYVHPTTPINLGLLYIEEPDETGHQYGPYSNYTVAMVEKMDELTGYLLWNLYRANLLDKINLIFTADHGMADVPYDNVVMLDKFINATDYTVYGGTPNWNVLPNAGMEQKLYDAVKNVSHLTVYKKKDIPTEFHYAKTPGVMPLQFVSDLHWRLAHYTSEDKSNDIQSIMLRGKELKMPRDNNRTVGEHGYNNSLPEMHPYFIGFGPAFKQGVNVTQFKNLDVYNLLCYILGVTPAPNNGSFEAVRTVLSDEGLMWPKTFANSSSSDLLCPTCKSDGHHWSYRSFTDWTFSYGLLVDLTFMLMILLLYTSWMCFCLASVKRIGSDRNTTPTGVSTEKLIMAN